ncbi:MAG: thioredoxin domain-containing protein [Deltaproteobacteria bacterium]|jgi:protein-disulfide isomerase/uncharacterized membrane protein|nr:thioredoxin domain-containing protein [Deltaproteobacteria bacterium]
MLKFSNKILILTLFGLGISVLLLYHHVAANSGIQIFSSYCSINELFDCDAVAKSKYSVFLGIPIASYGLFFYCFFVISLFLFKAKAAENYLGTILVLAVLGLIPSLIMAGISIREQKICLNCSFLYLINTAIFILVYLHIKKNKLCLSEYWVKGLKSYFKFFLSPSIKSILVSSLLLLILFVILILPDFVFLPLVYKFNGQSNVDPQKIAVESQMIFENWQNEEVIDFGIRVEGDLSELDFYYGAKEALHTIVVWTDFECPFCRITTHALMSYINKNKNKFNLVFKNYPLDMNCNNKLTKGLHENACRWAKLARCAGLEDGLPAFWNEYEKITRFKVYLPAKKYELCASQNPVVSQKLQADIAQGIALGLSNTPTIYIDGKKLNNLKINNLATVLDLIAS